MIFFSGSFEMYFDMRLPSIKYPIDYYSDTVTHVGIICLFIYFTLRAMLKYSLKFKFMDND